MYLQNVIKRDPQILEAAINLHQEGIVPPNTWVVDLDAIVDNARVLASEAERLGLTTYLMSKQHNRNPYINKLAIANGLNKIVAVDATCALHCKRYDVPLGHAGHLNQVPKRLVPDIVALKPDVITIYNVEHARWIDDAAAKQGFVQDVIVRVYKEEDVFFDGQEGGFHVNEVNRVIDEVHKLKNVRLVGATAFPCATYTGRADELVQITPNMDTVKQAIEMMKAKGLEITQVNAPGNTSHDVMGILKEHGATHVEPGNSLLGTTPYNAFRDDQAERTAFAYITEISHIYEGTAYAYGGGVYHCNYSDRMFGLVGPSWDVAKNNKMEYDFDIKQDIDYHMQLKPAEGQRCQVGDSAVFAYRTQMHMTRSYVAPVSGLSGKRPVKMHYLFDNANTALDKDYNPVDPAKVIADIEGLIKTY